MTHQNALIPSSCQDEPNSNRESYLTGASTSHIDVIYQLLGNDVVLLPCPLGEKGCREKGWPNRILEETKAPEYQQRLKSGNIAVLLGPPSNGLCAIDIDDDAKAEEFLAVNPKLNNTLRTRGSRGCQLWIRVQGGYATKVEAISDAEGLKVGEWRGGDGCSMIHGRHPTGVDYTYVVKNAPVAISCEELVAPRGWKIPWTKTAYEQLVDEVGPPFTVGKSGAIILNQHFFARRYALEHQNQVLFERETREFFEYEENSGLWKTVSEDSVKKHLHADFVNFVREQDPDIVEALKIRATNRFLKETLELLRGVVESKNSFRDFIGHPIVHCQNAMVIVAGNPCPAMAFSPHFRSRNQCPTNYRPGQNCNRFLEWLRQVVDEADVELLQRIFGYVLLPGNDAQKIFLFLGVPNSGKSVLVGLIERVIGCNNVAQLRTEHLGSRFELAGFLGKTLLTGKDVAKVFLRNDNAQMLKRLVGGDRLDAELKNANGRVTVWGRFNVIITSNHTLLVDPEDDPDAWSRRLVVVNFVRPYQGRRIPDFERVLLKDEGDGILAWALEGAVRAEKEIRGTGDLILNAEQSARINRLVAGSRSMELFIKESVVRGQSVLATEDILQRYRHFCEHRDCQPLTDHMAAKQLAETMNTIFELSVSHSIPMSGQSRRGYRGVTWRMGDA